jgi:hypothetical protein
MVEIFSFPIVGEIAAAQAQCGVAEAVVNALLFLILLAVGGYLFVFFFKRSRFGGHLAPSARRNGDEIKVIALRVIGRKCLVVVEHFGRRFLLAMVSDGVVKVSEWEISGDEDNR